MQFKNYKNPYTKNSKIYSDKDIYNMKTGESFARKKELLAQNRTIGVPTEEELSKSDNVVWVNEYTREDGTDVKGHWRAKPGNSEQNNDGFPLEDEAADENSMQTPNEGDLVDDKISPESTIVSAVLDVVASFLEGTEGSEIISSISPIINAIAPIIFNDEDEFPEYDFGSESDNQVPWEKSQSTKPASVKGSTPPYVQDTTKTSTPPMVKEPIKGAVPTIVENTQNKLKGDATGGASEIKNKERISIQEQSKMGNNINENIFSENNNLSDYYKKLLVNPIELPKYLEYEKQDKAFIKPVEGNITSDYGSRPAPTKGASRFHKGIDIGVPIGTPVKAVQDGVVKDAGETNMGGYGIGIFVEHSVEGSQIQSEYGHLSKLSVKPGDKVKKGQIIGYSGNSGISTGPHLHLTIKEYNKNKEEWEYVNPRKYVKY